MFENLAVNNNEEGQIVQAILDCFQSGCKINMARLKSKLSIHNGFFDGVMQRDAYECFQLILGLLHQGTKYSILGSDDGSDESDEFLTSICKSNFSIAVKKTLTCLKCNNSSVNYNVSLDLHVYPSDPKELQALIFDTMTSSLQKGCVCSTENTTHSELLEFEDLPKILFIIVNRYNYSSRSSKNKTVITLNKQLSINGLIYNHSATIYHHGERTTSGHYTAKIFYTDAAYNCDDSNVSLLSNFLENEESNSCYLVLYTRAE